MGFLSDLRTAYQDVRVGKTDELQVEIANIIAGNSPRYSERHAGNISTVYTSIKILAETLGRLPLGVLEDDPDKGKSKLKDHDLWDMLHYNPNPWTSSMNFITALETTRNYTGNSFGLIERSKGDLGVPEMLEVIENSRVLGYVIDKKQLYYRIKDKEKKDKTNTVPSNNILHFKLVTRNGIWGVNPIEALRLNLSTTWSGMNTIDQFYKNNAMNPKAVKSTVSGANQKLLLEAIDEFRKNNKGPKGAGDLMVLPPNAEIQELGMKAIDVVFLTMMEFNSNQISALFGVPTHLVGNMTTSKYNSIEATQIGFKVNTMSAIARMYRQEFEYKLLTKQQRNKDHQSIEFNLMGMVETDHKTRFEGYKTLSNIGAITPNDIARLEGLQIYPGGEDHYIQTNMQSVEVYNKKNKSNSQNDE